METRKGYNVSSQTFQSGNHHQPSINVTKMKNAFIRNSKLSGKRSIHNPKKCDNISDTSTSSHSLKGFYVVNIPQNGPLPVINGVVNP